MSNRGCYTALLPDEAADLISAASVDGSHEYLNLLYLSAAADQRVLSVDKSWDAMHRVLSDGSLGLKPESNLIGAAVLGGRQLSARNDWIVSYVASPAGGADRRRDCGNYAELVQRTV
jgi:hypothetical protein